ncbi:Integral membrane protein 2 [Aphelenchoides fujianensis]|nr:Integral membrane protein 2 [Aphelenchoides fujianensis]
MPVSTQKNAAAPTSPTIGSGAPIIVTVAEKNALADETNPVLTTIPMKLSPPAPPPISIPPPAYSAPGSGGDGGRRGFVHRLRSKLRRPPRWSEDRVSAVCVPIILTWLLVASFFAGLLFYRYFGRRIGEPTFYRWCGTEFLDAEMGERQRLEQKLEINEQDLYERIQVPKFGSNRPAVFVHDFRKNITAIVDVLGDRCFLKDLDRSLVSPPKNFIDLIQKMEKGYYAQNPRVIRETYRVGARLSPAEMNKLGSVMVSRHCVGRAVYRLDRASRTQEEPFFGGRQRREAPTETLKFAVMNGGNVALEDIVF